MGRRACGQSTNAERWLTSWASICASATKGQPTQGRVDTVFRLEKTNLMDTCYSRRPMASEHLIHIAQNISHYDHY
uniref:Secreted protein n=1 Tax=Steinernema glaseri TaxID=37863 RepID=A0A1I7YMY8_9BILA